MEITLTKSTALCATEIKSISKLPPERPEGILNSNYKALVRNNFKHMKSNSIFGVRQAIKSRQYVSNSSIDIILKLSVFAIVLSIVL